MSISSEFSNFVHQFCFFELLVFMRWVNILAKSTQPGWENEFNLTKYREEIQLENEILSVIQPLVGFYQSVLLIYFQFSTLLVKFSTKIAKYSDILQNLQFVKIFNHVGVKKQWKQDKYISDPGELNILQHFCQSIRFG